MNSKWYKFRQLSQAERYLLAQALLLLPLMALALRVLGFRRLQSVMARLASLDGRSVAQPNESMVEQAGITARVVKRAAWHGPYRGNCLQQSFTLWWMLRRQGMPSELRIGVRKDENSFQAHAWVEFLGCVVNDSSEIAAVYTPFAGSFGFIDNGK